MSSLLARWQLHEPRARGLPVAGRRADGHGRWWSATPPPTWWSTSSSRICAPPPRSGGAQDRQPKRYVEAIRDNDMVFGIGPAGTGKTYLAVAMAVSLLTRRGCRGSF